MDERPTPEAANDKYPAYRAEMKLARQLQETSDPWRKTTRRFSRRLLAGDWWNRRAAGVSHAEELAADKAKGKTKPQPVKVVPVPGRNKPCHCGSGKKFKKCHGGVA